jgi:arylsulfatase A-like enzyme
MDRRNFIKSVAAASAAQTLIAPEVSKAEGSIDGRPNFLFIIADDLTHRAIHSLTNPEVRTPNIDQLAARGCAFTHCFQQGSWLPAVCVASRTMLNTGLSAFRSQKNVDFTPLWGSTFRESGYDTYIVGKWHLDPTTLQRSFSETDPIGLGMFESTPSAYHRPSPEDTWTPWDQSLEGHWLDTKIWQGTSNADIHHSSVIWSDCAVDHLLNKVAKRRTPFFMYVGFNAPHDPRQSPKEFVDQFPRESIKIPPNFLPEHPFDLGDYYIRDEMLAPFPRTKDAIQLHRSEYYAIISHLDTQIGRILDALEKTGKSQNTYVILTADHGLAVGEHGLMGKQNMYDCSIRVPWIIAGPDIEKGRRVDELVYQHSTFATTCELAGIPVPKAVEFPSCVDLIKGGNTPKHDAIFSRYRDFQRTVRTKDYKLIVYPQAKIVQLFDMKKDPWEIHNLAAEPGVAAVKAQLIQRLHQFQQELDDELDIGNINEFAYKGSVPAKGRV